MLVTAGSHCRKHSASRGQHDHEQPHVHSHACRFQAWPQASHIQICTLTAYNRCLLSVPDALPGRARARLRNVPRENSTTKHTLHTPVRAVIAAKDRGKNETASVLQPVRFQVMATEEKGWIVRMNRKRREHLLQKHSVAACTLQGAYSLCAD